jgi:hypothetical protein
MRMKVSICRVSTEAELLLALEHVDDHVLPILFTDNERDRVADTVAPNIAALSCGRVLTIAEPSVRDGADDVVLSAPSQSVTRLAARYAAITRRRLVIAAPDCVAAALAGVTPSTVTWFCALDETDLARSYNELRTNLYAALGRVPPLAILTAENLARLTWFVVKQLIPTGDRDRTTTIVSAEPTVVGLASAQRRLGGGISASDAVSAIEQVGGTLLINAHSRPHCGILPTTDGTIGICGLPSGGADGHCVDGTLCHFGSTPRIVLQNLRAPRVYFNGCTTAGPGSRRSDFLPRSAMVLGAVVRSGAREYVGNLRSGLYTDFDLYWFLGACALGCTPAESVVVVDAARDSANRDRTPSLVYVGDATHPAWPVEGVTCGRFVAASDVVRIEWPQHDGILIARVTDRRWAGLATSDRLHVRCDCSSNPLVQVIADPWHDAVLVLALPRNGDHAAGPLVVELAPLSSPIDRHIGDHLASALDQVRWLVGMPSFHEILRDTAQDFENTLVTLRRAVDSRDDLRLIPELMAYLRNEETHAARSVDGIILGAVLTRLHSRWNFSSEYMHRVRAVPRTAPLTCPVCGAFAQVIDLYDHAITSVQRSTTACGYCGIVADEPHWPLRLGPARPTATDAVQFSGSVEVSNLDVRPRTISVGVAVRGAGAMRPTSHARGELDIPAGGVSSFTFSLCPERPMREVMQACVVAVSEGGLGFASQILVLGRET